jgi:hypothetical protein
VPFAKYHSDLNTEQIGLNVTQWIEALERKGRISFSLNQLKNELPGSSGSAVQRLGYLMEQVIKGDKLADELFEASEINGLKFFRVPLKASLPAYGYQSVSRWKVIENSEIV